MQGRDAARISNRDGGGGSRGRGQLSLESLEALHEDLIFFVQFLRAPADVVCTPPTPAAGAAEEEEEKEEAQRWRRRAQKRTRRTRRRRMRGWRRRTHCCTRPRQHRTACTPSRPRRPEPR